MDLIFIRPGLIEIMGSQEKRIVKRLEGVTKFEGRDTEIMNHEKWQPVSGSAGNSPDNPAGDEGTTVTQKADSVEGLNNDRKSSFHKLRTLRKIIEKNTTPWKTGFLLVGSLAGSVLYLLGIVRGGLKYPQGMELATLSAVIGLMVFGLFFPLFVCLYFSRGFLEFIKRIEKEVFPNDTLFDESEDDE